MYAKLLVKNKGVNTLKENILGNCNGSLKKLYVVLGTMKETGYEVFEECLIDSKARKLIILGVDKKYTTKKMLESLLKYTKNVHVYAKENSELESNIFVFEYLDKAEIYLSSGSLSDSYFEDNKIIYTVIGYDLKNEHDKKAYDEYITEITKEIKSDEYKKLEKELINELAETKQIFTTKQYVHNVMSISELLGKDKEKSPSNGYSLDEDEEISIKVPKVDLSSLDDISIDVEEAEQKEQKETDLVEKKKEDIVVAKVKEKKIAKSKIKEIVEEYVEPNPGEDVESINMGGAIDIESMLFEKSHIKLDRRKVDKIIIEDRKEKKEREKVPLNKVIDLSKISNVIIELKDKPTKGKDVNALRIPNQIRDLVPAFFETAKKAKNIDKAGEIYKENDISLEIIDIVANEKRKDSSAYISAKSSQSYFTIVSDELTDVEYKEGDLARIIKLADSNYHIEIIPQEIDEYNIWKKLCNHELRGSTKRFGVM